MPRARIVCLFILLAVLAEACSKRVPPPQPAPPEAPAAPAEPPPPAPPPPPAAAAPADPTEEELFARKSLDQLNAERPLGTVFFDLDSSMIRDDARLVLQRNAEWLRRWTTTRITVEGHCDERGSAEYNLALGERRSAAVRDYLVGLGVASDRVVVVSKGKEAPVCAGSEEGCWQQNRRGAPIIIAK